MKTITLCTRKNPKLVVRKIDSATHHIEFGNIVCKDKYGNVVQTINLTRYAEGLFAKHQLKITEK